MLSKSKIKKLGQQLSGYGVSMQEQVEATGVSRQTLWKIYRGQSYDKDVILKLIAIRNEKLSEATELEDAI